MDKTYRTEFHRLFLVEALPDPLTRASAHLQLFDNYIADTRLRIRSIREPETKEWTRVLQQRFLPAPQRYAEWKIAEIHLNEKEHALLATFEGTEIRKNRYFHEFDGMPFAFDVYLGPLWGLNRARVDFQNNEDLEAFLPPPFLIFEVTENPFFFDENLVEISFGQIQAEVARIGPELLDPHEMTDE